MRQSWAGADGNNAVCIERKEYDAFEIHVEPSSLCMGTIRRRQLALLSDMIETVLEDLTEEDCAPEEAVESKEVGLII